MTRMPLFENHIDLNLNEIRNLVIHLAAGDPAGTEGQLYFNTATNELKYHDGVEWQAIGTGAGGATTLEGLTDVDLTGETDRQVLVYSGATPSWVNRHMRLDEWEAPEGSIDLNGQRLLDLGAPVDGTDAATKGYVDSAVVGIDWKNSVRVATTVAGTLATDFEDGDTVDGVVLATGDRILIKNQVAGAENGIYVVNATGAPTRAADFDADTEVSGGAAVFIEDGTVNADTGWLMTNNGTVTVGTTALSFTQFNGLGALVAGDGLTKTGNTINVVAGTGITAAADSVSINFAIVARKHSEDIGDGASTAIVVTHDLGTRDVNVTVREAAGAFRQVFADVAMTSVNTVTVTFAVAPDANEYRVTVLG